MNDQQQLEYIKTEFGKNLKNGLLNLHICWLIDQAEKLQNMESMIPWIKYDPENPPETGKSYLVSDGRSVDVAWFERYFDDEPSTWYPPDRSNLDKETCHYYAPINLPGEETE